jgi:putative nucleotidyltransferase with HDIG domain
MNEAAITPEIRLKRVQRHIAQMPSLSTTVTKVLEICDSPTTSPNDLNRVISLDPVLVGQVLRLINSAYYSLPQQVTSLTRAIIMLGLNTVKNLALSTAVLERIAGETSFQALSMNEFWTHSICVGVTAKSIATIKRIPVTEREEYFVAGLLHDLGKIPLNDRFPEEYAQVLESAKPGQCPLYQAENMIFGIDHSVVGGMIAEKWQLSEAMNDSLCCHHNPDEAEEGNRPLIEIVALANAYANAFAIGSSGDPFPEKPMVASLVERVGVSWSTLSDLRESVLSEIEEAKIFLRITQKGQAHEH